MTAGCSTGTSTPSAAPASPAGAHRPRPVRGTISAENGGSWTVTTAKGVPYTVNITPTTAFGTTKAPATAHSFPTGDTVVVMGTHTGTATIDAVRIITAPVKTGPTNPTPADPAAPTATG
jgi:hypothetical protein